MNQIESTVKWAKLVRQHIALGKTEYLTEAIIDNAARLARKHGLRANDAVQLSTAIDVRRILAEVGSITTALVTADLELNVAAVGEGFSTEDLNNQ